MTETTLPPFPQPHTKQPKTTPETAADFLRKALNTLTDRANSRDTPSGERSMRLTVALYQTLTGQQLSEREGWLFMICLKLARGQQGAAKGKVNLDDYIDLAGYAALIGESQAQTVKHR